jgi:hypothetical protein
MEEKLGFWGVLVFGEKEWKWGNRDKRRRYSGMVEVRWWRNSATVVVRWWRNSATVVMGGYGQRWNGGLEAWV